VTLIKLLDQPATISHASSALSFDLDWGIILSLILEDCRFITLLLLFETLTG